VNRKTSTLKHVTHTHTVLSLPRDKRIIAQYVRQLLTSNNIKHHMHQTIHAFLHSMKAVVTKI